MEFSDVKITVIKKLETGDIFEEYAAEEAQATCDAVRLGDEFVSKAMGIPEGFCGWAWADMQKLVYGMARGGVDVFVTCCTDGYRPVVFKLKKLANK